MKINSKVVIMVALLATAAAQVQGEDEKKLTLDRIFAEDDFKSQPVEGVKWGKKAGYTTLRKPEGKQAGKDLVWHNLETGQEEVLVPAHRFIPPGEENPLEVEAYEFSADESLLLIYTKSRRVWRTRSKGDYWVLDITGNAWKKLGGDAPPSSMMFAQLSPDGKKVAFVRENNLYVQTLRDLHIVALTEDGGPKLFNGTFDWVYEEELGLRNGFRWSPDSQQIAYWQIDASDVSEFRLINNLTGLYSDIQPIPYPKTGEKNSAARVGVVSAEGGETKWLEVPGDEREHYLSAMDWTKNEGELIVQQFNRLQNTQHLWRVDVPTGEVKKFYTETDTAWVDNQNQKLHWFDNGERFLWLSERDGWNHAYAVSRSGEQSQLLTVGDFDVIRLEKVDADGGWLYYSASPENATQQYLCRVKLDGTGRERVSPADQPGTHTYDISEDGRWAVHIFSTFDEPLLTELVSLPDHKTVRVLADNKELKEKLAKLERPSAEFFQVKIEDGVTLDGWCLKPPMWDEKKKYPVLFFVYGEPAGQTVQDRWPGKRQLWHWMMAQLGYVVISIDNRGTPAAKGREWRKCIYRQVGQLASADQAAAVQALLKERPYLDPQRVAVWGWSGGGSMTLNALFRYPDLYQAGISIAPVPNQRLYDTIYQERYMGLPSDNAEGYRRGSPLNFAHQLKGRLLLIHGTGDDNCHYQGTEALIHELIAHNKQFSMFAYPNRSHSISEGPNTTRHLYGLMTQFLLENVAP